MSVASDSTRLLSSPGFWATLFCILSSELKVPMKMNWLVTQTHAPPFSWITIIVPSSSREWRVSWSSRCWHPRRSGWCSTSDYRVGCRPCSCRLRCCSKPPGCWPFRPLPPCESYRGCRHRRDRIRTGVIVQWGGWCRRGLPIGKGRRQFRPLLLQLCNPHRACMLPYFAFPKDITINNNLIFCLDYIIKNIKIQFFNIMVLYSRIINPVI